MTDRNNGVTAVKVEILLSLIIPNIGAFGFDDGNIIDGIDVEQIHNLSKV